MKSFTATLFLSLYATCCSLIGEETALFDYLIPIEVSEETSGFGPIDCIYVVNLKVRPDRWKSVSSLAQENQLHLNRVEAVNGWILPYETIKQIPVASYSYPLNPGQIGCILSHVSIWKDAFERGFNRIWIMEDDVDFANPITDLLPILEELDTLDPDWDILYTDQPSPCCVFPEQRHLLQDPNIIRKQTRINKDLTKIVARWGTHSMIISRGGLYKLLEYISNTPLFGPIDYQINFHLGLNKYALSRNIVFPGRSWQGSDTTHPPKKISSIP